MQSPFSPTLTQWFLKVYHTIEGALLVAICAATVFSIVNEFLHIFSARTVELSDILLLFIYLEVLAMVQQYVTLGKIPVRYPIYISIIAIARYITLGMKEMDGLQIVWLGVATLILSLATLVIRFGHHRYPYEGRKDGDAV